MDNFDKILEWNPAFYRAKLADDHFLLIGETESFLFHGEQYRDLLLHVNGCKSLLAIISQFNIFSQQALVLNTIDELMRQGLIRQKDESESTSFYFQPDFDAKPLITRYADGMLELRLLTEYWDQNFTDTLINKINLQTPVSIVIVDDYLDPRLSAINRFYTEQKRPWLLLKPFGRQPLIGPFFTPAGKSSPCWQCLADRLLHNQPVRRWLQQRENKKIFSLPVCYEMKTIEKVLSVAVPQAQKFIDQQLNNCLRSINPSDFSTTEHPVTALPHCSHCGTPGLIHQRRQKGITLRPSPKTFIADGGVRSLPPSQTIANLEHLISPLTGIIRDLSPLPGQKKNNIPIYRSSFFKTPGPKTTLDGDDFMQISLGKGISEQQSKAGALCESIERHAVQYRGDEPRYFYPAAEADFRTILPGQLATFSETQYKQFNNPQLDKKRPEYAVEKYDPHIPIHWTPAWSFNKQEYCHVPFTYCYANTPFAETRFSRFNSNGCAAGNTLEEALLQGFLELVERDAVAIWWYNKITRPSVRFNNLPRENIQLLHQTLAAEWEYWVLDLTHDFHIPVMAAVGKNRENGTFRLGFGCHLNPMLACQRALTELCQLIAIKNRGPAIFNFDHIRDEPFLRPLQNTPVKTLSDFRVPIHSDIKNDVLYCLEKAKSLGFETQMVDSTRPDIPIHTLKVIVPGLCHMWPQLGNERLYQVPVTLGRLRNGLSEDKLNQLPLLI